MKTRGRGREIHLANLRHYTNGNPKPAFFSFTESIVSRVYSANSDYDISTLTLHCKLTSYWLDFMRADSVEKPVLRHRGHSIVPATGRYVEQVKFTFLADQPELSQNMFLPLIHPLDAVHQLELHVRLLLHVKSHLYFYCLSKIETTHLFHRSSPCSCDQVFCAFPEFARIILNIRRKGRPTAGGFLVPLSEESHSL